MQLCRLYDLVGHTPEGGVTDTRVGPWTVKGRQRRPSKGHPGTDTLSLSLCFWGCMWPAVSGLCLDLPQWWTVTFELWPNIRLYLSSKFLLGVYYSNKKRKKIEQTDSIDRVQSLVKWVEGVACLVGRGARLLCEESSRSPQQHTVDVVVCSWTLSTREEEAGKLEIHGCSWL